MKVLSSTEPFAILINIVNQILIFYWRIGNMDINKIKNELIKQKESKFKGNI